MGEREVTVRRTMPTYTGFVASSLAKIYAISIEGTAYDWFRAVMNFSLCVPREVKDDIRGEFSRAKKALDEALDEVVKKSSNFDPRSFPSWVLQNRVVTRGASHYAPRLMNLLVDSLDAHGYLKESFVRFGARFLKELREREEG